MGRVQRKETSRNKKRINKIKPVEKTRKQLRKEKRQQQKISRAIYYQKNRSRNQSGKTIEKSTRGVRKVDNVMTSKEKEEERGEQNNERGKTLVIIF